MKISEQFPTRFISATDVAKVQPGSPFVIAKLAKETGLNPKTKKQDSLLVVYFRGTTKGHRLRKSEHKKLIELWGDDDSGWVDKSVTLTAVSTQVGDGVRLKPITEGGAK